MLSTSAAVAHPRRAVATDSAMFRKPVVEWASVELLKPHLDEGEGSLGTHIDVSHLAATPPGFNVTVDTEVTAVEGRRVWFKIHANDGVDTIGEGRHERAVVIWNKFNARVAEKAVKQ